jgi:hypothetical protein
MLVRVQAPAPVVVFEADRTWIHGPSPRLGDAARLRDLTTFKHLSTRLARTLVSRTSRFTSGALYGLRALAIPDPQDRFDGNEPRRYHLAKEPTLENDLRPVVAAKTKSRMTERG